MVSLPLVTVNPDRCCMNRASVTNYCFGLYHLEIPINEFFIKITYISCHIKCKESEDM